jgi:hypothetical protein
MKRYDYSWSSAAWDTLPETCRKLEDDGWEILTVCPLGGSDFCRVVTRKEIKPPPSAWDYLK